jgi:antitoxin component of RelBE/YafQ-DinJ toxin-antitoxin module
MESNFTIAKASKRLGIKASTARMILNKYKQTGEFPMKQFKNNVNLTSKLEELAPEAIIHPKNV